MADSKPTSKATATTCPRHSGTTPCPKVFNPAWMRHSCVLCHKKDLYGAEFVRQFNILPEFQTTKDEFHKTGNHLRLCLICGHAWEARLFAFDSETGNVVPQICSTYLKSIGVPIGGRVHNWCTLNRAFNKRRNENLDEYHAAGERAAANDLSHYGRAGHISSCSN